MKGTIYQKKGIRKGVPFLSKMIYKMGKGLDHVTDSVTPPPPPLSKILFSSSPMGGHYHQKYNFSNSTDKIQMV